MRSKVAIIRGSFAHISPQITVAPIERVNADNIVLITALKYPQTLPDKWATFEFDPTTVYGGAVEVLEHWRETQNEHLVAAEYAHIAVDRGSQAVKAVEGDSLMVDWYYETIRNYHRHFGQTVIDCTVNHMLDKIEINGKSFSLEAGIDRLKPHDEFG